MFLPALGAVLRTTHRTATERTGGKRDVANTIKKVTWIARATTTIVGLAIMLAFGMGVATTALAGTGIGATFNLGQVNSVNAVSRLVGSVAGLSVQIDNNSTGTGATALDLQVCRSV